MFQDYSQLKLGQRFSVHRHTLDSDMAAEYARAVQDANPPLADETGREIVPPMAVAALSLRGIVEDLRIPGGTLHAGQEFEFGAVVRVGDSLRCDAVISQNSVRGGWRFLSVECAAMDEDADGDNGVSAAVMTGKSVIMIPADATPLDAPSAPTFILCYGPPLEKGDARRATINAPLAKGDALPTVEKLIDQELIDMYAQASGDYNPIHVDAEFAATTQFGGTIAHGMMVAAAISEMMSAAFGIDWARSGKMKMRFRSPVKPGQRAAARGEVRSVSETESGRRISCSVSVTKDDGETAISGTAEVIREKREQ